MTIQDLINELEGLGSLITQYVTGTQAQYDALSEKDEGTIYFITDRKVIYKGETCYSGIISISSEVKNDTDDKEEEYHKITISPAVGNDIILNIKTIEAIDKIEENIYNAIQEAQNTVQDNLNEHISTISDEETSAHVKLSDSTESDSDVDGGTAATPKAVSEALQLAKKYTEEVVSTQGSFEVLKGYVATGGIIESAIDSTINGINIDSLTGYKKGWAFLVKVSGNYVGVDCGVNDKIICVNDYVDTHYSSDFIVMQVNVDGTVTSTEQLTKDTIIVGDGGHSIKHLANGGNKQVMTIVGGKPSWADNVDTTYTFADGTDGSFNVTPKGGQTQKIKIGKPSNAGHADTAEEATLAKNADNATRADSAIEANHALNADEAIHSDTTDLANDLGGKPETHEENFVYQPTAADLSIKDGFADIKKLKGNTVVLNQKLKTSNYQTQTASGITITNNNDGSYTLSGVATDDVILYSALHGINSSHKYLLKGGYSDNILMRIIDSDVGDGAISGIITTETGYTSYPRLVIIANTDLSTPITIKPQLIDLTQMFGEGNEPTIEEFEAMFPNDYYEYNEGELMSFDGKGLKSVGFNQWDEEWELGAYDISNGNKIQQNTHLRNVNPIKILGGTDYYFKSPTSLFLCWYDSEMKFINSVSVNNSIIKSPSNAAYLNFYQYNKNTYDNDICINLSHSGYRNGDYEPYEDYTLQFQDGKTISQLTGKLNGEGESVTIFPDGLKSAGSAYDEIVFDKNIGKYKAIQRIGSVDMGTLDWVNNPTIEGHWIFYAIPQNNSYKPKVTETATTKPNCLCVSYDTVTPQSSYLGNKGVSINNGTGYYLVTNESFTDVTSCKASLQGQILYYELAEPEVYELDFPINTSYEAYDFGTEEVLYNDDNEVNIPMKASVEYGFNAVDMIRGNYFDIQKLKKGYLPNDGIAASAKKLATPRSFKISGGAESEAVKFDGTDDVNLNVTKVKNSVIDWEGVTNITDKNIVNTINYTSPSKANIPNEYAVAEAVTGIIDLLTWKTL